MIPWPHSGASSRHSRKSTRRKFKRTDRRSLRSIFEALERRALLAAGDVLANHYTAGTTGEDPNETVLTPSNVNQTSFGKVFTTTLDGQVYAQILAVANVNITRGPSQGIHNVLFAATQHDSLYAIDATTGAILWQDNFTQIGNPQVTTTGSPSPTAGTTTIPGGTIGPLGTAENALVNTADVGPELGILATPTIDPNTGILYLVADTQELRSGTTPTSSVTGADWHYVQRLWAINIANGAVAITPSNNALEPTSGGQVIGDTIYNPTTSGSYPSFSSYSGYKYVAGPYVKGSGDNGSYVSGSGDSAPADGWVTGSGDAGTPWGAVGKTPIQTGYIPFNALLQMNRVATTLINGEIYLGFASHGDDGPYYGWILGYSASTLSNNVAWVSVPNFEPFSVVSGDRSAFIAQAGFWNAGSTFTTDGTYLYISSGNGAFNPNPSNFNSTYTSTDSGHTVQLPLDDDYGDAVLKLQLDLNANQNNINLNTGALHNPNGTYDPDGGYNANGYGLKVVDYFVASNVFEMNLNDEDVGSGGVLLIPSTGAEGMTAHFNSATGTYTVQNNSTGDPMLVTAGKEGRIYLIDANNLGGYNTQYITDGNETTAADPAPYDNVIGEFYYYETTSGHSGTKANNQTYKGYDIPSYFNGEIYVGLGGGSTGTMYVGELGFNLASFPFTTATPRTGVEPTPNFVSSNLFGGRGTTAAISSNGLTNGIIWNNDVTQSSTDYLAAYSVSSTGTVTPIYTTNLNSARDSLTAGVSGATGVKFSIPTVFDGMVYDGTGGGSGTGGHILGTVVGYGLITTTPPSLGIFTNNQDIGGPSPAGTSSFNSTTGVYTVAGGGNDISGTSDQFQFLYKTLTGDGSITAEVTSMTNTNSSAKAGIMFRDSTAANGIDPFLAVSASGQPIKLEGRNTDGGTATIDDSTAANLTAPYWIRLTRIGSLFSAYTSPDGTTWTFLGSITVSMGSTALVGLAVSSHAVGSLNTSTFQSVSVLQFTSAANASPPTVTSTTTILNAVASENGSGTGITYTWSTTNKPNGSNPQFSVNGTNAAQSTTVTFNQAGSYSFLVTATDAAGVSITSNVNVTVNQTLTSISVSPPTANLTSGQTQSFSATALDQFGLALAAQPSFTWTVDNGSVGSVNSSGLYTAPLSPVGSATVRATSGAVSGTASITVSYLKGDVNLDGHVDMSDVRTLMQALTDLGSYQFNHQLSNQNLLTLADIDGDGQVTNGDLQALLNLLIGGGGSLSSASAGSSPPTAVAPATASAPADSTPAATLATDSIQAAAPLDDSAPVTISAPAVINLPVVTAAPSVVTDSIPVASPPTTTADITVSDKDESNSSVADVLLSSNTTTETPATTHTQIEIDVTPSHSSALPFASDSMVVDQSNPPSTFTSPSSVEKNSPVVDQVLTAWTARRTRHSNAADTASDAADSETLDDLFAALSSHQ